jgi:hypothetical protein
MATERYTTAAVELDGVTIPRGALVYVVLSAANRDEDAFGDASHFDIARQPNRHLALLERFGRIDLQPTSAGELRWRRGLVLRGLEELPVWLSA